MYPVPSRNRLYWRVNSEYESVLRQTLHHTAISYMYGQTHGFLERPGRYPGTCRAAIFDRTHFFSPSERGSRPGCLPQNLSPQLLPRRCPPSCATSSSPSARARLPPKSAPSLRRSPLLSALPLPRARLTTSTGTSPRSCTCTCSATASTGRSSSASSSLRRRALRRSASATSRSPSSLTSAPRC